MKPKKNSPVFEMIQGFDKSEKRAFKIYASTYELKSSRILALFDIIYDYTHTGGEKTALQEKDIDAAVRKAKFSDSQYTNTKNRLKVLLLDFLYEKFCKDEETEQIHRKAVVANLMLSKGHWETGKQMLLEAKKMAVSYEDFEILLMILHIEIYTLSNNGQYDAEAQQELLAEIKEVSGKAEEWANAIYDTNMVRSFHLRKAPMPQSTSVIDSLEKKIKEESSVKIRSQYYLTLMALRMQSGPPAAMTGYAAEHVRMLEEHMRPNPQFILRYFVAFGPYMLALLSAGDAAVYMKQIQKMEAAYLRYRRYLNQSADTFILLNTYKFKLMHCRLTNDRTAMAAIALEAEENFIRLHKMVTEEGILLYRALLRNSFFYARNYAKAEEWAIRDFGEADLAPPVVLAGYIVEMLCAWELGYDLAIMRGKVKKMQYYLANKVTDQATADFMVQMTGHIMALVSARSPEEKKLEITRIQKMHDDAMSGTAANLRTLTKNSDIRYWLEGKASAGL